MYKAIATLTLVIALATGTLTTQAITSSQERAADRHDIAMGYVVYTKPKAKKKITIKKKIIIKRKY